MAVSLGLLPAVLATQAEAFAVLAIAYDLLLLVAFFWDSLRLGRAPLHIERQVRAHLTQGVSEEVVLTVRPLGSSSGSSSGRAVLIDEAPAALLEPDVAEVPRRLALFAHASTRAVYPIRPRQRGRFEFGRVNVLFQGPLGLAQRRVAVDPAGVCEVRVYARVGFTEGATLDPRLLMAELGLKRVRRRSEGTELESLRDAVPEDELRRIDWRATARRGRLTARNFELEQNHDLILALDTGRLMGTLLGPAEAGAPPSTKLDRAIAAALRLASVALGAGDRVGLLGFGGRPGTFVRPGKGRAQLGRLLEATLDLAPEATDPSFLRAFTELRHRQKKRALLVFLTDFVDLEASSEMVDVLGLLAARHVVLFVALRDPHIRAVADAPITAVDGAYRALAAMGLEEARAEVIEGLSHRGIRALDLPPDAVTQGAIQAYLALRAREAV